MCLVPYLSHKQRIGMGVVLKYPLTQVLLYFANVDESIKAKLLQERGSRVASIEPASIDVMIIDAMFFLHLLVDPPSTLSSRAWSHLSPPSVQQPIVRFMLVLIR